MAKAVFCLCDDERQAERIVDPVKDSRVFQ
jgi:hypothetical protein